MGEILNDVTPELPVTNLNVSTGDIPKTQEDRIKDLEGFQMDHGLVKLAGWTGDGTDFFHFTMPSARPKRIKVYFSIPSLAVGDMISRSLGQVSAINFPMPYNGKVTAWVNISEDGVLQMDTVDYVFLTTDVGAQKQMRNVIFADNPSDFAYPNDLLKPSSYHIALIVGGRPSALPSGSEVRLYAAY